MKHYLTFKDDKSDKFWQIETNGKSFTVTYGKIGSSGTSQTKTFDSDEQCLKEAEKLLAEKKKKGYAEAAGVSVQASLLPPSFKPYLKEQAKAIENSQLAKALVKADWAKYSNEWYDLIIKHWEKLQSIVSKPIGNIVLAWADGADESLEIDYDDNNDKDSLYEDGANQNESVIGFENFSSEVFEVEYEELVNEEYDDFLKIKTVLCEVTKSLALTSMSHPAFAKIPKKSPYFLTFCYWHDDQEVNIIYDGEENTKVDVFVKRDAEEEFDD